MVRSEICNLHPKNIGTTDGQSGKLNLETSDEDKNRYHRLLEKYGEDPQILAVILSLTELREFSFLWNILHPTE